MAFGGGPLAGKRRCLFPGRESALHRPQPRPAVGGRGGCAVRQLPPQKDGISVLEVGAGAGLFAPYFLDEFQRLCLSAARDFYQRLTYVITDRSPATVEFWTANGVFAQHPDRVRMQVADAMQPATAIDRPLRAVFSLVS